MTGQSAPATLTALQRRPALALLKLDGDYWLLPPDEIRALTGERVIGVGDGSGGAGTA